MSRRRIALLALIALVGAIALTVFSCIGEPYEPESLKELLSKGRLALQDSLGSAAYNYYTEALEIDPDNLEAKFGVVISNEQRIVANLDGLIDLLAGVYVYEPTTEECLQACQRLSECELLDEIRSSEESCMQDCPWGLQPFMFRTVLEGEDCDEIRHDGIDWILNTQPEDCAEIGDTLELCGNINPPTTFDKETFVEHCPRMYVEHHSRCYVKHLGECVRQDRTCFEHTIVGFQQLFRAQGVTIPPDLLRYSEEMLQHPEYQFFLKTFTLELHDPVVVWELPGRFGVPELHFARAVAHFFNFFIYTVTSTNLDINTVTFDLNVREAEGFEETYWGIVDSLENVLYDPIFPNAGIAYSDEASLELIAAAGPELGFAFGDFARYLRALMADTERQDGKAMGYGDTNNDGFWDPAEYVEFKGLGLTINRIQAEKIADMCEALERNMIGGAEYPFDPDLLRAVLGSYNLWYIDLACRVIFGEGYVNGDEVDLSRFFNDPDIYEFRNFMIKLVADLKNLGYMFFPPE